MIRFRGLAVTVTPVVGWLIRRGFAVPVALVMGVSVHLTLALLWAWVVSLLPSLCQWLVGFAAWLIVPVSNGGQT